MNNPSRPNAGIAISPSRRIRRTPFSDRVEAADVQGYTVYNHMLLPTSFRGVDADYHHLCNHVQVWDVAAERQVQIKGPDADALVQWMTPRDLSKAREGVCLYAPLTDASGRMLNDPIAIRIEENHWWLSIADSDIVLWARGLALGRGFDVDVTEPDVSPLAIQGPKANELITRALGQDIASLKFFNAGWFDVLGRKMLIARSGWSHQGGFEIYLNDSKLGGDLWDLFMDAGKDLNVGPGCPNLIERIEAGLVSFGADTSWDNNPYEAGLARFCHPDRVDCLGKEALISIAEGGPDRMIRGLRFETDNLPPCPGGWMLMDDETYAGNISAAAMSPKFGGIGIAMIERDYLEVGTELIAFTPDGPVKARVCALPMKD